MSRVLGSSIRDAIRYGFPVGRVRVLEGRLLDNATLERLLDAPDFLAQKRVLSDTDYGAVVAPCESASDVERALDEYLGSLIDFLETSHLPEPTQRFFRLPYDFRNMKARLKAEATGAALEDMLEARGLVPLDAWSGPLEELPEEFRALDPLVRDAAGHVVRELIDPVVDRAMYEALLAEAERSKSEMLVDFARLDIDISSVRTLLRARSLGRSKEWARRALAEGGSLDVEGMLAAFDAPDEVFAESVARVAESLRVTPEELLDMNRLDILADNLLMQVARRGRVAATGVEPVLGYVMARRSEVIILRTLLLGKLAGLGADELRKTLRELYV
ncbi:MAG: V-type ATP synthase subunit C [Coriobacteriia bacterium]